MRRNISRAFLALAFAGGLAAIGTATPSLAQVYFDGPGFSVGVGHPWYRHHYYDYGRPYHRYWHRDYWDRD